MRNKSPKARGYYTPSDFRRQKPRRNQRATVLIVCEGSETEPRYFKTLRADRRLLSTEVEICGEECGSHPCSCVEYAVLRLKEAKKAKRPFDSVWCVFDRDEHPRIHDALSRAKDCGINIAFSNPCFELWFLMHFSCSSAYKERGQVSRLLGKNGCVPGYHKSMNVYDILLKHQVKAIENAQHLREYHNKAGNNYYENPSTTVDILVDFLNQLAEQ